VDHAGKSARGTRGGAFGAHGRGRSYSRGKWSDKFDDGLGGVESPVSGLCLNNCHLIVSLCAVGGGDQGYGSGRYDSRPGGYGYGYGRSRDYSGRWVAKRLMYSGTESQAQQAWVFICHEVGFTT
jgi:RNA-binding protein 3